MTASAENAKTTFFEALGRLDDKAFAEAERLFLKTLEWAPGHVSSLNNLAVAQFKQGKAREALATYDQLLAQKPDLTEAWVGRGNILTDLGHYDEAGLAFDTALSIKADSAEAWVGRGNVFNGIKRHHEALSAFDKALSLNPAVAEAWLGRGNLLGQAGQHELALAAFERALSINDQLPQGWLLQGDVLSELRRYDLAFAAYHKAFLLKPDLPNAEGSRLHCKMQICDWHDFDAERRRLTASLENGKNNSPIFAWLVMSASPEKQLQYARQWTARTYPAPRQPIWRGERYRHDRIHVAYVSADFHEHATAHLMARLFECHDGSKFQWSAISLGPDDGSAMRRRLVGAFERFVDASQLGDDDVARKIRTTEIDILVDLKGFTQRARPGILARRPAPIQVSYLGYPGTMGATYIDYLIADQVIIPQTSRIHYAEKIVTLPDSYQANDPTRPISDKPFTRAACGLPPSGFVFCCFNNSYKILPDIFQSWMRILQAVPGSVLWLLGDNPTAIANLKSHAAALGVDAGRLVFAERIALSDHLARHRQADLFLDTLPCNAHTTASDALWAGLPVLSRPGETFAGRVASSLLAAIGLPELSVATPQAYERFAIELATEPAKLAEITEKLKRHHFTAPLFDATTFARNIESAYTTMVQRHAAGLSPDHICVPRQP
jgi:protein O-GlcNAc transferase